MGQKHPQTNVFKPKICKKWSCQNHAKLHDFTTDKTVSSFSTPLFPSLLQVSFVFFEYSDVQSLTNKFHSFLARQDQGKTDFAPPPSPSFNRKERPNKVGFLTL